MEIHVIAFGTLKESYLRQAVQEYEKRLSRFCKINIVELKEARLPDNPSEKEIQQALEKEKEIWEKRFAVKGYTIALDIQGSELTSEKIGKKLGYYQMSGVSPQFIIGSSYGLHEDLKKQCRERWSFSKLTFPHQLMRVMLLEQLYRGYKILNHETYHK